jgi:hypothetical protein
MAGPSIIPSGPRNRRSAFAVWAYLLWNGVSHRNYGRRRKDAFPISGGSNIRRVKPIVRARMGPGDLSVEFSSTLKRANGDRFMASILLAHTIVRVYLGDAWVDKYVNRATAKKISIFTHVESPLLDKHKAISNYLRLSENLYNLQVIPGFDECIERLRDGDIEGAFAELEFGGMLARNRVPFRYVVPSGTKGRDYDIDILHHSGLVVCADAKCKIESTAFSRSSVISSLEQARKQLPKDRPCLIFVKVPGIWRESPGVSDELGDIAREFLRKRKRVLAINYYTIHLVMGLRHVNVRLGYAEISNDATQFGENIDWRMFRPEWSGNPPWWQSIMYYPDGRPR